MIKTIIFDLGGFYLNRGMWIAEEKFAKKYQLPLERVVEVLIKENYKDYFSGKITEQEYWKRFLSDFDLKEDWKNLRKVLINSFKPQKGMPELIKELRKNYRIGLLSDQTKEWWPHLNKKYKISDNFDFTIISAETGFHKPQIEIYKIALENANCKPKECLFIDDLEYNLEPAKKLGIQTLLFKNPDQIREDLQKLLN
jgi:putative hydrolase of the HAD superfamily